MTIQHEKRVLTTKLTLAEAFQETASAAVNAPNSSIALAYVDKGVEFILLGILLRIRTAR